MASPLVCVAELKRMLADRERRPAVLDVRWELSAGAQRDLYHRGHIPGAAFVDLDHDLAGEPGDGGRHPLPSTEGFTRSMRAAGVSLERPVVTYDAATSMAAARAWWLLRYFGHPSVAVLDGGLAAWQSAGGEFATGSETVEPGDFVGRPGSMPLLDASGAAVLARDGLLLDARAPERFTGALEPIDPVAGHIPGARNRPTTSNLDESGMFRDSVALRGELEALGAASVASVGTYCGSGVTAAHQLLALELAGIGAALYAGSWSEWITDPARPVAIGDSGESATFG